MIRLLQGSIHSKEKKRLIFMVNGVGYDVLVPNSEVFTDLQAEEGQTNPITLHIYTHVREDAFLLYGFKTEQELRVFKLLTSINGIGPKMALEILNMPPSEIQQAVATENVITLTKIPGVGKKTAQRMILELKSKLEMFGDIADNEGSGTNGNSSTSGFGQFDEDAVIALENLGYKRQHIHQTMQKIDAKETEEIIREFLKLS
jgi:Holliday junction DNA helicase RuvA